MSLKKKVTHKKSATRTKVIAAISMLLVSVLAGATLTYAWFQNFLDISGTRVQTGKMLYEFSGYHYSGETLERDFFYSTQNGKNGLNANETLNLLKGEEDEPSANGNEGVTVNPYSVNAVSAQAHLTTVDTQTVGQSFFVVSKLDGSIDFDVGLAFSFDYMMLEQKDENGETIYVAATDCANSMWFKVYNESAVWSTYMNSTDTPTVEGYADANPATGEMLDSAGSQPLSLLAITDKDDYSGFVNLSGNNSQMLFRVVYGWSAPILTNAQVVDVPVKIHLSVAQVGSLTGIDEASQTVKTYEQFRDALTTYKAGSTIYIDGHITYSGDLTISRPLTLIISKSLTVQGNLSFVYTGEETSEIRTRGGGQLFVEARNNYGGDFVVDLPRGSLRLTGSNKDAAGQADIYVAGEMRARSRIPLLETQLIDGKKVPIMDAADDVSGLAILGARICHMNEEGKNSTQLQSIKLIGAIRLYIAQRTRVGEIVADYTCNHIQLLNMGYVSKLDLQYMLQDRTIKSTPAIYVESRGYWVDEQIRLPNWAMPFLKGENTLIMSNYGSGPMKAKTPSFYDDSTTERSNLFYADYETSFVDDIKYEYRSLFVEKYEKEIEDRSVTVYRVYYESIHPSKLTELGLPEDSAFGTTLESIISYYCGDPLDPEQKIPVKTSIAALEVICDTQKVLTVEDYAYIRSFGEKLIYLDLSKSASVDGTLPRGALKGLKGLTYAYLPESDHTWMPEAFANTNIRELWFPSSLELLKNDLGSKTVTSGNKTYKYTYSKNNVIGNIRVIHTTTTVVDMFGIADGYSDGKYVMKDGVMVQVTSNTLYLYANYEDAYFYDGDDSNIYKIKQYIFTPDTNTRNLYRSLFGTYNGGANNRAWQRCVFVTGDMGEGEEKNQYTYPDYDENGKFLGFYVLRLNENNTCEFITYTGNSAFDATYAAEKSSFRFNFDTITVNDQQYKITSIEEFAFATRINKTIDLTFGDEVASIGQYSFGSFANPNDGNVYSKNWQKLNAVTFKGETSIGSCSFYYVKDLKTVAGQSVKKIGSYVFDNCIKLETVTLPSLSTVGGVNTFNACTSLKWLHTGVIERTDTNVTQFLPALQGLTMVIHTESAGDASEYTASLGTSYGRLYVESAYAHLYTSNYASVVAETGPYTLDTIPRADANGVIMDADDPREPSYYFYTKMVDGEECAVLVTCLDNIDGQGGDYTTLAAFTDPKTGKKIPVTRIGTSAYRLVTITGVDTLTIPDSVTVIGASAFYSDSLFPKNCITFDLNQVVEAETCALYKLGCVRLVGNELTTIGTYTLSSMTKMIVACLPKLDVMKGGVSAFDSANKSAFAGCSALRVAYVGPSRSVRYLQSKADSTDTSANAHSKYLKMFFINATDTKASVTMTNFNQMSYVVGNCDNMSYYKDCTAKYGYKSDGGTNFSNVYLSDWYTIQGVNGGVSYSVTLPGYLYIKNGTSGGGNEADPPIVTLSLRAVARDLEVIHGVGSLAEEYMTPDALYVDEENPTVDAYDPNPNPNGPKKTIPRYVSRRMDERPVAKVTALSQAAYNYVALTTKKWVIAPSTTSISNYALYQESSAIVGVETLDLGNVTSVGTNGLGMFGSSVTEVTANKLKTLGQEGFSNLSSVKNLYLPALTEMKAYALQNMSSLKMLVLGKNFTTFGKNPLYKVSNPSLQIVILNETSCVKSPTHENTTTQTRAFGSGTGAITGITVVVSQKLYGEYQRLYEKTGWYNSTSNPTQKVPFSSFSTFEYDYPDKEQNLTFFWSKVDTEERTAKITSVVGSQIPATLVFPDKVTEEIVDADGTTTYVEWTVVAVDGAAIKALTTVRHIQLPAGMQYLAFIPTDLPSVVESLTISEKNTKFKTIDGALYSGDGRILFVVPRGLVPVDGEFYLPETVTSIADQAFYNVTYVTKLYVTNPVRIGYRVFSYMYNLTEIHFAHATASEFVGRDIFLEANAGLIIYVPADSVDAYKSNLFWLNFDYVDKINPRVEPEPDAELSPDESGGEDPPDDGA